MTLEVSTAAETVGCSVSSRARCSTSYGWSIVTMHLSATVMEIRPLWSFSSKCSSRNRGRSSVGPQYYIDLVLLFVTFGM